MEKIFAVFAPAHAAPLLISTEQMRGVLMVATVASLEPGIIYQWTGGRLEIALKVRAQLSACLNGVTNAKSIYPPQPHVTGHYLKICII